MNVKVKVFAALRELLGTREVDVNVLEGATLSDVLEKLVEKYGSPLKNYLFSDDGELKPHFTIYVNSVGINELSGLKTPLKEGDVIAILPPVSGG